MLLWLVFGVDWPNVRTTWRGSIFLFLLFLVLGWQVFGSPVKG